jgi:alpha-ketoglutarate-dependent taurine dioxygenase
MKHIVDVNALLTCAESVTTTFAQLPDGPVHLCDVFAPARHELHAILDRFARHGFAVVQLDPGPGDPEDMIALANALDLGAPFTPPLYKQGGGPGQAIARLSLQPSRTAAVHPSFDRAVGLEMHCDGTLQDIGVVKTVVLLCRSPAAEGGDTTLLNAAVAYRELITVDPAAALALARPGVLVRQANINGCTDSHSGPAFAVQDNRLICGYSVAETDRWDVPDGVEEADLRRGVDFLRRASQPGSPYFAQLRLGRGQAIMFDNTRVSHGRTPYRDDESHTRCMFRGLFLRYPRLSAEVAELVAQAGRTAQ